MASWDHDDLKDNSNFYHYADGRLLGKVSYKDKQQKVPSSGGPSKYYDMPFQDWVTTNDQMEWLAEYKWGKYAIHLKDIFKGLCRWGEKEGTDIEYDTRKIIYYGLRVLRMVVGVEKTREYLNDLLQDKQFGGVVMKDK